MLHSRTSLRQLIRRNFRDRLFVVVSNREPYSHAYSENGVRVIRPPSGVAFALDPIMQASGGLWVAHGSGDADSQACDSKGHVRVPPENPSYTLKRIWLTKQQEEGHYYGFSNSALWPLCHIAYRRPVFEERHWHVYREVNALFADSLADEIRNRPAFIFVQDYHFALLPRMLKQRCPNAILAQFWHIPWPNPEVFRICPWKEELLDGLLGNDILCFHIRNHCMNFIDTVDVELEARPDREMTAIVYNGKTTRIRAFPISIDFEAVSTSAPRRGVTQIMKQLREQYRLPARNIGIGIDRLDYTKGIPERLRAVDRFLERYPDYAGNFAFIQVGVPSRIHVEEYRKLADEVDETVEQINWKYRAGGWVPIVYIRENQDPPTLQALYRLARFCLVTSLHDGMNLVAKEFVAANVGKDGVLILSQFTGAARQLRDALIVNPYAPDEVAETIHRALTMDDREVHQHMHRLRESVRENNVYKWAVEILQKACKIA